MLGNHTDTAITQMSDVTRRLLILLLVGSVIAGAASVNGSVNTITAPVCMILAAVTTTVSGLWAGRVDPGRRVGWTSLAACGVLLAVTAIVWQALAVQHGTPPPTRLPWLFPLAAAALCAACGLVSLISASRNEFGRRMLDVLTVAASLAMGMWVLAHEHPRASAITIVPPERAQGPLWEQADDLVGTVAGLSLLIALAAVLILPRHRASAAAWPAGGWLMSVITTTALVLLFRSNHAVIANALALFFASGLYATTCAVMRKHWKRPLEEPNRRGPHPYLAHGALLVSTALVSMERVASGSLDPAVSVLMGFVVILVVLRSHLTLQDNNVLLDQLKAHKAELLQQAQHDPLTSLHSRAHFTAIVDDMLSAVPGREVTIAYIDLDHFKGVNDTYGHGVGDALLVEVAHRMRTLVPKSASAARLSGDEFVLVVPEDVNRQPLGARIVEVLGRPYTVSDHRIKVSCSVGIASWLPGSGRLTTEGLLRRADLAMYEVKKQGKNGFRIHTPHTASVVTEDRVLAPALAVALQQGDISPHFQPIIDITTQRLIGFEALSRWNHDGLEVMPTRFVAMAERAGLLTRLTDTITDKTCRQIARWNKSGHGRDLRVGINVGGHSLQDPAFARKLVNRAERHHISPSQLYVEITETVPIADMTVAHRTVKELVSHGIGVALDDFGTGYNSLSLLLRLPLTMVKIDRGMIHDIDSEPQRLQVVTGLVDLARHLNLIVVAEGVEHAAQLEVLQQLGVDYAQGYLYGRPRPAEAWCGAVADGLPPIETVPQQCQSRLSDADLRALGPLSR